MKTQEELLPVGDNSPAADDDLLTNPQSQSADEEVLSPGGDQLMSKKSTNKEAGKGILIVNVIVTRYCLYEYNSEHFYIYILII